MLRAPSRATAARAGRAGGAGGYAGPVNPSLQLGRVAGIRIGVNWSWLVVFGLITWTLADTVFPDQNPGLADRSYVAMALAAALLFFCSLLLHELGHALVARREGMTIEGVTLWLFGGVAQFRGRFPSAGAEFRIAVAGPLVSLVIGVVLAFAPLALALPDEVDGVCVWLGYINLTLLVFNLLPALPLDGGRILRSALWRFRGDFGAATRLATGVGGVIGAAIVLGGLALLAFRNAFSGLWLAFVGWFVLQAASAERRTSAVQQALSGVHVRDLMLRDPVSVGPQLTLGRFWRDVAPLAPHAAYPVVDDGAAVGLLAFRDAAEVPRADWEETTVSECMIPRERVPVLREDEELVDALAGFEDGQATSALVLDGERVTGLLASSDLARVVEAAERARRR